MKLKHLILIMALGATSMVACNASGHEGKSAAASEATASDNSPKLDLSFLKDIGVDVTNIHGIDEANENFDVADLDSAQLRKLWPMVAYMNVDETIQDHYIKGAKALARDYTMLLFGAETGDDSSTELLAVYDKDGNMTDYMQLSDYDAFVVGECDDNFTRGTAQVVDTKITFPSSSEFVIDRTEKEGSWTSDGDKRLSKLTHVKWLVQTVSRYKVDDKGHIELVEKKEVKREGKVPADRDVTFDDISMLPASTPGRIARLNTVIIAQVEKLGVHAYLEDMPYDVQMVVAECFAADPTDVMMWIYDHRDKQDMITEHLKQCFVSGWLDSSALSQAIGGIKVASARDYLLQLTGSWKPTIED